MVRERLSARICQPNTVVDTVTVVAHGAALYGGTILLEADSDDETATTGSRNLQLRVGYESTSLTDTEWVTVECQDAHARSRALEVELQRTETGWSSGRQPIGERGALLKVTLEYGRANVFAIRVTDASGNGILTNPSEITIIQGTKVGGSPLPRRLGLEVEVQSGDHVFKPLRGAEKDKPLPVTGISRGDLRTPQQLRPGVPTDELVIRIFEGEDNAPGTKVLYSEHIMTLKLTGTQVNQVIPAGSRFDLTVETDDTISMPVRVALLFEALDEEFELPIPDGSIPTQTDWIEDELRQGRARVRELRADGHVGEGELARIEDKVAEAEGPALEDVADPDERRKAVSLLQEALRELDHLWSKSQWPRVKAELGEVWADLRKANREEGYADTRREMRDLKGEYDQVVQGEDAADAGTLIVKLRNAIFRLKRCEWSNNIVQWARAHFSRIAWKNPTDAREAVNEGVQALLANRPCSVMLDHARRILSLVSEDHAPEDRAPRPPVPISEF